MSFGSVVCKTLMIFVLSLQRDSFLQESFSASVDDASVLAAWGTQQGSSFPETYSMMSFEVYTMLRIMSSMLSTVWNAIPRCASVEDWSFPISEYPLTSIFCCLAPEERTAVMKSLFNEISLLCKRSLSGTRTTELSESTLRWLPVSWSPV